MPLSLFVGPDRTHLHQAWGTFRPRTNADVCAGGPPAHELVFLRKCPSSFADRTPWPTVTNDDHDGKTWCQGASVGLGPYAQYDYPATHGRNSGCTPATLAQEKRQTVSDICAAVERPLLVPCLRSGAASLAPAAAARESTTTIEKATNRPQEEQHKGHSAERSGPAATVGLEATITPHKNGAERQEGSVSCMIEASVRAGDWVLTNRGGVSKALGGKKGTGWLRVEAVSVG